MGMFLRGVAIAVFPLSEWINDTSENNSAITFRKLIIYDLNIMQNLKKKHLKFLCSIYCFKQLLIFCSILTFSKAFDSIPDF